MAKPPVKKTSPADKKIAALIKRVEALEDQGFAQKLLNDDLENRLEQAENAFKNIWNTPINSPWNAAVPATPYHECHAGNLDVYGNASCVICGKHIYTITTTTGDIRISNSTGIVGALADDIDITWVEPWTLSDGGTKE